MAAQTINEKIFDKVMELGEAVAVMVPIVTDLKKAVIEKGGLTDRVGSIEALHDAQAKEKEETKKKREKWDGRTWVILIFILEQVILLGFLFAKAKLII